MIMRNESGTLSDDEIAKMIAEAVVRETQNWRSTVEFRNAMDQYIYNMNTKLNNEKLRGEMMKKDVENIKTGLECG